MPISEFYLKYADIRLRIAPFRLKTDFETQKTVAVIEALINRAENLDAGASNFGRFGFVAGHNIETYMERAERYTVALERGEFPLQGMFAELGMGLVDHSFIEKDGKMHVFYNRSYVGFEWDSRFVDTVGHSFTENLIDWTVEAPALSASRGGHDDYQVWAPAVVKKDDTYYMYYTGVNINIAQAICLATSKDLYTWKKYENNPIVFPGEWGKWNKDEWSDCRDPMVFIDDDGVAYMYFCTSKYNDEGKLAPALGVASSTDMISWKDEGAYFFDICDITLESPFVMKRNGKYYLFYTNCGYGTAYAVSDDPIKNWKSLGMLLRKQGEPPVCPANVPSCAEVFEFKGKWYISCAQREPDCEQYLEIFELTWNGDGTVSVGKRIE